MTMTGHDLIKKLQALPEYKLDRPVSPEIELYLDDQSTKLIVKRYDEKRERTIASLTSENKILQEAVDEIKEILSYV